jgi:hypothetical protein
LDLALVLGTKVERATASLPQTATQTLFTVSGGRVVVTSLFGTVTSSTGSTAGSGEIFWNPSVGGTFELANEDLTSKSAGYSISYKGSGPTWVENFIVVGEPFVLPEGNLTLQTTVSNTGQMSWTLTYIALDEGATITAV